MKKLQVPYNLDKELLPFYEDYKMGIKEVYFAAPSDIYPTARRIDYEGSTEEHISHLIKVCDFLYNIHIESYVLLNGSTVLLTDEVINNIKKMLDRLNDHHLTGVIISNPIFGDWIKNNYSNFKIKLSVLSNINRLESIKQLDTLDIFDEICLSNSAINKIEEVKEIKKECKMKIGVIVNSGCRQDCPLYGWHHQFFSNRNMGHQTEQLEKSFWNMTLKLRQDCENSPHILPEDLYKYDDIFDIFKLEGRDLSTPILMSHIASYVNRINPKKLWLCNAGSCQKDRLDIKI